MRPFLRWLASSDKHPFETNVMIVAIINMIAVFTVPDAAPSISAYPVVLGWGLLLGLGGLTNIAGWFLTYKRIVLDGAALEQIGMALVGFCLTAYGIAMFFSRPFGDAVVMGSFMLGFGIGSYVQLWKVAKKARRLHARLDKHERGES